MVKITIIRLWPNVFLHKFKLSKKIKFVLFQPARNRQEKASHGIGGNYNLFNNILLQASKVGKMRCISFHFIQSFIN